MKITRIGLDISKRIFQVHGVDELGRARIKKKLPRSQMLQFCAQLPMCVIGIEACGGGTTGRANSANSGTRLD